MGNYALSYVELASYVWQGDKKPAELEIASCSNWIIASDDDGFKVKSKRERERERKGKQMISQTYRCRLRAALWRLSSAWSVRHGPRRESANKHSKNTTKSIGYNVFFFFSFVYYYVRFLCVWICWRKIQKRGREGHIIHRVFPVGRVIPLHYAQPLSSSVRIRLSTTTWTQQSSVLLFSIRLPSQLLKLSTPRLSKPRAFPYILLLILLLPSYRKKNATHSLCALTIKLHTHTHKRWEGGGRWCGKCWGYRSLVPVYSVTAHWIESFLIQTVYIFFYSRSSMAGKDERTRQKGKKAQNV